MRKIQHVEDQNVDDQHVEDQHVEYKHVEDQHVEDQHAKVVLLGLKLLLQACVISSFLSLLRSAALPELII